MKPTDTTQRGRFRRMMCGVCAACIVIMNMNMGAMATEADVQEEPSASAEQIRYETITVQEGTLIARMNTNIRNGAGTQYDILTSMKPGETCEVLGEENGWYHIRYGIIKGYISGEYLSVRAYETQIPYVEPTPMPTAMEGYELVEIVVGTVISTKSVNLRAGAGEKHEILMQLAPLEACRVMRNELGVPIEEDGWYQVQAGDVEGYIAKEHLELSLEYIQVPIAEPSAEPTEPDIEEGYERRQVQIGTVIAKAKVNLREGAGTEYKSIMQLSPDTEFIVIGEEGDWYQAEVEGKIGFVTKEYVSVVTEERILPIPTPAPTSTPEPTAEPTAEPTQTAEPVETPEPTVEPTVQPGYERRQVQIGTVTAKMKVNLREGAGTEYESIMQLSPDTEFIVIGEEGDWYQAEVEGKIGFVTKEYVSVVTEERILPIPTPTPEPTETPVPTPTAAPGHELREVDMGTVIASAAVSVREDADINSAPIAYIAPGKTCIVVDDDREWYRVEFDGYSGYIAKEYLSVEKTFIQVPLFTSAPTAAQQTGEGYETVERQVATVTANAKTNVRAGAGTEHDVVVRLDPGAKCFVLGEEGDWYQVEADGKIGYISKEFVKVSVEEVQMPAATPTPTFVPETTQTPHPAAQEGYEWVERIEGTLTAKMETNVRAGAGTGYDVVTRMNPGDTCMVLGSEGSWYRIEYQGIRGYIAAEYISTRTYEELVEIIVEDPLDALLVGLEMPNIMRRGETRSLKGIIDSNIPITSVTVTIENLRTMTVEMTAAASFAHDADLREFDLMQLDDDLKFRRLKAGEKRLTVTVGSTNDEQVVLSRMFYVTGDLESMSSITSECKFSADSGRADRVKDSRYSTAWQAEAAGDMLHITVPDKYSSETMTVEWNSAPEAFDLILNGMEIAVDNSDQRIHFTFATGGASEIDIRVSNPADSISEVRIYPQEKTPEILQDWQVPGDKVDMMVIVAHQGDEFLLFGGAIPQAAAEGKEVLVVYMADCGRDRYAEAMNGLWTVGVRTHPVFLGLENGNPRAYEDAIEMWGLDETYEMLAEVIRRYKPDVVLTHDINGEDGDNQQKLTSAAVRRAVLLASDSGVYPDSAQTYGAWDVPKTYVHLYEANIVTVDTETPLAGLNGWTAEEAFRAGLHKNTSLEDMDVEQTYTAEDGTEYSMHSFGLIRTNVGYDEEKNSFFENIQPASDEEQTEQQ